MNTELFYNTIKAQIQQIFKSGKVPAIVQNFLDNLDQIMIEIKSAESLKMTRMTILFEGFYRSLSESALRKALLAIKLQRWENHFGTPTVTFLLSYKLQIEQTCLLFKAKEKESSQEAVKKPSISPWQITTTARSKVDQKNDVIVDSKILDEVIMPGQEEKTGQFLKTHNPSGGFTTTPCDPYSQEFIKYAEVIAKQGGKVLEIGAAFGAASLQALAKGAVVYCNDIEPQNLAVIRNRYLQDHKKSQESLTGDEEKLVLVPGSFPEELSQLPKETFDAILICRVMHFFPGKKIEESLQQMAHLLKPGGKIFIICETPFLKNWQLFIPEHEKRVASGIEWPGEITNPAEFESSGRAASLPQFVHWITKDILDRSLLRTNMLVSQSSYINRLGQFPNDLLLDGRESVGAVGEKQIKCKL